MDGDPSHKNIIAQCCWDDTGRASVYIVNYSPEPATGHVILPADFLVAQSPGFPIPNTHNLKAKKAVPLSEVINPLCFPFQLLAGSSISYIISFSLECDSRLLTRVTH